MKKLCALFALTLAALAQDINNPQQSAYGSITTAGTGTDCTVAASCVAIAVPVSAGALAVQLSGTFSATLQIEQSVNGATWVGAATLSAPGISNFTLSGSRFLRVRASSYTSGPVTVNLSATAGGAPNVAGALTVSSLPHWRMALAKQRDGQKDAKILCVGDSITEGYGDTTTTTNLYADAYPARLVTLLKNQADSETAARSRTATRQATWSGLPAAA
jgi:hypothetical protein